MDQPVRLRGKEGLQVEMPLLEFYPGLMTMKRDGMRWTCLSISCFQEFVYVLQYMDGDIRQKSCPEKLSAIIPSSESSLEPSRGWTTEFPLQECLIFLPFPSLLFASLTRLTKRNLVKLLKHHHQKPHDHTRKLNAWRKLTSCELSSSLDSRV